MDAGTLMIETGFAEQRQRIMQVRYAVFVKEQGVPAELEQDDQDPVCRHALLLLDGRPVATGRLEADGHIGRIAVVRPMRGKGLGSRVVAFLEDLARARGLRRVYLGAQVPAIPFYEKLGYRCYGAEFLDAGIVHRHMEKWITEGMGAAS
jgi:predicted GNAT family N-acyltransferase